VIIVLELLGKEKAGVSAVLLFAASAIIWDVPDVMSILMYPFSRIISPESIHEFVFRTHLDHFSACWGMLLGAHISNIRKFVNKVPPLIRILFGGFLLFVWGLSVFFSGNKFVYNAIHPYIMVIPIIALWLLRNCHPILQKRALFVFVWIGRRSLEFYLLQFHILLQTVGNKPKFQLVWFHGFPLLNTIVTTGLFVFLASVAFDATRSIHSEMTQRIVYSIAGFVVFGMVVSFTVNLTHWVITLEILFVVGFAVAVAVGIFPSKGNSRFFPDEKVLGVK
jgi:hypothetical protein